MKNMFVHATNCPNRTITMGCTLFYHETSWSVRKYDPGKLLVDILC
jgi:hypothetical protein